MLTRGGRTRAVLTDDDQRDVLQLFKDRITRDLQHNWVEEAGDLAGYKLDSILEIAKSLLPELDIKALHN
ncbi:MAG: hypothetical protein ABI478_13725, partial [Propionivibrio sp.]